MHAHTHLAYVYKIWTLGEEFFSFFYASHPPRYGARGQRWSAVETWTSSRCEVRYYVPHALQRIDSLVYTARNNSSSLSSSFLTCNSRLRNAVCRPHPPHRPVLDHIHCFRQCEIVGSQILLYGAQPREAGASAWCLPVLWRQSCSSLILLFDDYDSVLWHCWLGNGNDIRPVNRVVIIVRGAVRRPHPRGLLESSGGRVDRIRLASALSSIHAMCPKTIRRRDWTFAVTLGCPVPVLVVSNK